MIKQNGEMICYTNTTAQRKRFGLTTNQIKCQKDRGQIT